MLGKRSRIADFALSNVAFTYASFLLPVLRVSELGVLGRAGKASLTLARMYRTALIVKNIGEIGQFVELLDAIKTYFSGASDMDAIQKVAPSKRGLVTMQTLAKLDKP